MPTTVAQMTPNELRDLIRSVVIETIDHKFAELGSDYIESDDDGEIRPEIRQQLLAQLERTKQGEMGVPMSEILEDLGLIV